MSTVDVRTPQIRDTTKCGAERIRSPLISFNHVIDPHFVTFSSSLYTTIRNPNVNPNLTLILTLTKTLILNLNLTLTLALTLIITVTLQ